MISVGCDGFKDGHHSHVMTHARLQHDALSAMCNVADEDTTFEHWNDRMIPNSPTFKLWDKPCRFDCCSSSLSDHTEKGTCLSR